MIGKELGININPKVTALFGLSPDSTCELIEVNDPKNKSAALVFVFGRRGENGRINLDEAEITIVINREQKRKELILKSLRIGGTITDLDGIKRTLGIRYSLSYSTGPYKSEDGVARMIEFSLSKNETEGNPDYGLQKSPVTTVDDSHNTAGIITKQMGESADDPDHVIIWKLAYDDKHGEYILSNHDYKGLLRNDHVISKDGVLSIFRNSRLIKKIPEYVLRK